MIEYHGYKKLGSYWIFETESESSIFSIDHPRSSPKIKNYWLFVCREELFLFLESLGVGEISVWDAEDSRWKVYFSRGMEWGERLKYNSGN